jgi:transcriptional regulator with XRE-family HTH domain
MAGRQTALRDREIIDLVKREIEEQGWSLRQMETASGVSRNAMHKWTSGRQPGLSNLRAVLNTLGYDIAIVKAPALRKTPPALRLPVRRRPLVRTIKLDQDAVDDIRTQRLKGHEYAKLYGISEAMVSYIIRGKRWPEPASRA